MTQHSPDRAQGHRSTGALVKKYWLPVVLTVVAVVFIAQNTGDTSVNLFSRSVTAPAWLVYTILVVLGLVIGSFAQRRRIKRRTGLR